MITAKEYKFIADEIGGARNDADEAVKLIIGMQKHLSDSEVIDTDIDKLGLTNAIEAVYFLVFNKYFNPKPTLNTFVQRLQSHVVNFHGPVNEFLKDNGIQVLQDFADLSEAVGFSIDIENIL